MYAKMTKLTKTALAFSGSGVREFIVGARDALWGTFNGSLGVSTANLTFRAALG